METKKYLLIILSLFFINFLSLNATVLLKDNSRQLISSESNSRIKFDL